MPEVDWLGPSCGRWCMQALLAPLVPARAPAT